MNSDLKFKTCWSDSWPGGILILTVFIGKFAGNVCMHRSKISCFHLSQDLHSVCWAYVNSYRHTACPGYYYYACHYFKADCHWYKLGAISEKGFSFQAAEFLLIRSIISSCGLFLHEFVECMFFQWQTKTARRSFHEGAMSDRAHILQQYCKQQQLQPLLWNFDFALSVLNTNSLFLYLKV